MAASMYKRTSESWLKHLDFILLDMFCLQIAFLLAYGLSGYGWDPYAKTLYRNMAFFIEVIDFLALILLGSMSDVLKRSVYREFVYTVRQGILVGALSIFYLFLLQQGQNYSRLTLILTVVFYSVLSFGARQVLKSILLKRMREGGNRSLLIVSTEAHAEEVVKAVLANNYARYTISGIVTIDEGEIGACLHGVRIIGDEESLLDLLCKEWVDEVLVVLPDGYRYPRGLIERMLETGVVVHYGLEGEFFVPEMRQFVENIAGYTVVTTSINCASAAQLVAKRAMDIVIGLMGCVATGLVALVIAPVIWHQSPGPLFFSQERVGRNGKRFKMYKFRSMYLDAEERKEELMEENKLNDPKMFKLDFDPRVIGNFTLADGTRKTGVGNFIRRTSLDEFPQFFNVLKGEMSVVGTRPPLVSETVLYESRHRARLAIKPGITGLWQISGRSNITDFEEVVRLDREYISNWSIHLDLKILLKTIAIVIKGEGSL